MSYDEALARRIDQVLAGSGPIDQKKMFGGVCYLHNGNMLCGVHKDCLILRLGPLRGTEALNEPGTRPFDITGRPMKGWVMVEPSALTEISALTEWIARARRFVETLPPK